MTAYNWDDTYNHACQAFGQRPRAEDEQATLDAFERNPRLVINSIDEIAQAVDEGKVKWGWSALAKRLEHAPSRNVTVTDANDKETAIAAAERWIANAGIHYERWEEVRDELFGNFAFSGRLTLKPWADDQRLIDRMHHRWEAKRPAGEQIEREELERADKWKADQAKVRTALRPPPAEETTT